MRARLAYLLTWWAHYLSTYCAHHQHDQCRLECKICKAPCRCWCHRDS